MRKSEKKKELKENQIKVQRIALRDYHWESLVVRRIARSKNEEIQYSLVQNLKRGTSIKYT